MVIVISAIEVTYSQPWIAPGSGRNYIFNACVDLSKPSTAGADKIQPFVTSLQAAFSGNPEAFAKFSAMRTYIDDHKQSLKASDNQFLTSCMIFFDGMIRSYTLTVATPSADPADALVAFLLSSPQTSSYFSNQPKP